MQSSPKWQLLLVLGTLALFGFLYSWLWGLNRADELWFFYLAKAIAEGKVLYKDVVWHVFPASLYLTAAALKAIAAHVFVLKLLAAVVFALSGIIAWKIAQHLGKCPDRSAPFFLTLFLLSPPIPGSIYGPLAYLFLLSAAFVTLRALQKPSWQLWLLAGSLAGLAAANEYNVGLLVLAAVVATCCSLSERGKLIPYLAAVGIGFTLVVGVTLVPVWQSGAWHAFKLQAFGTKHFYLKTAWALPLQGKLLHNLPPAVVLSPCEKLLRMVLRACSFLCVPLGVAALARLGHEKKALRRELGAFGLFLVAAILGAFPRFDSEHVLPIVPVALIPLFLLAMEKLPTRWLAKLLIPEVGVAALTVLLPLGSLRAGTWKPAELPHLTGARIGVGEARDIEATLNFARGIPRQDRILFLGPYASFYYLTSGIHPPTPQVFPLVTELGNIGQEQLIERLDQGEIHWVCMQRWSWALRPARLEEYVERHLILETSQGECSWWRNPRARNG